jgi:hypothetical protein
VGNDRVEPQIVDAGQYRWDNPIFLLSACTALERFTNHSIMKKALLLISVTVAASIVTITTTLFAMIYVRDSRTIEKAKEVVLRVDQFCLERGRLPETDEFAALFPGLTASVDWFYWPTPDRAEVRIQYPMSSHHRGAPGTSKTSEFTATTYAYIMSVKCSR